MQFTQAKFSWWSSLPPIQSDKSDRRLRSTTQLRRNLVKTRTLSTIFVRSCFSRYNNVTRETRRESGNEANHIRYSNKPPLYDGRIIHVSIDAYWPPISWFIYNHKRWLENVTANHLEEKKGPKTRTESRKMATEWMIDHVMAGYVVLATSCALWKHAVISWSGSFLLVLSNA